MAIGHAGGVLALQILAALFAAGTAADVRSVVASGVDVVADGHHKLVEDVPGELTAAVRAVLSLGTPTVAGSLLIGVPAGIALSRYRLRGTGAVSALLLAPLTVPGIALGLAIYLFLILIEIATRMRKR